MIGTYPLVGPIGKLGVLGTTTAAADAVHPAIQSIIKGAGTMATGAAQGATAATMTGGDPVYGAVGGGAAGGLGNAIGAIPPVLQNLSPTNKAIADRLIQGLTTFAGGHFGGLEGLYGGQAAGPVITEVNKHYGPTVANAVARGLKGPFGTSGAGIYGGQYGDRVGNVNQPTATGGMIDDLTQR